MMRRMGSADAFFLDLETPRAYNHTFKIAILDPSDLEAGWSFDTYREAVRRRIHRIPLFRWRYLPSPLGLAYPLWVDDPDFNLDYHLRRTACPSPGDQRALCELMSAVYAYQLDRSRPLWITWVVEGLEEGKVALVTLIHHAYVDGAGASNAMLSFFNPRPEIAEDPEPPEWQPGRIPVWPLRLVVGALALIGILIRGVPPAISGVLRKRRLDRANREAGKPAHPSAGQMLATPLNRVLSHGRTLVCESMPLQKLQQARIGDGTTLNDVYMSCCAGAIRRQLQDMGYDTDQGPLVAGVPIAGERPPGMELQGNFATADYCWLHTEIADPLQRLRASHDSAAEMKRHIVESQGSDIASLVRISPQWMTRLIGWTIRRQQGRLGLFGNVVLSNVPGPREPLYLGPTKLANWFSTGQVFDGSSLNITLWSYCGQANLCILADRYALPDGWKLFDYFCEEVELLINLAKAGAADEPGAAE